MAKKTKNLLRDDPTGTSGLRRSASAEAKRRWAQVNKLITKSIVQNKVFHSNVEPLSQSDFIFLRDSEKLDRFDAWLKGAMGQIITSGGRVADSPQLNWMLQYFQESYERGAQEANENIAAVVGRNQVPFRPNIFAVPFHLDKVSLLFTRDFTQLEGITDVVAQQTSRVLSEAMLNGYGARKTAKLLRDRVDKIGKTRSILLARTEITNAHQLGTVNEGLALQEILGEEILYEWFTVGDVKVRDSHIDRNRKFYSYSQVILLLGEPNCRCAITAVPLSLVPEGSTIIR